ncbi:MarR family transcriptional regulator [Novosphingobium sp. PhB165]|uniref:MarR family winged helix-turn-helix transcriptional regulator n=1 Tax=Novosphingobium sp. PhB165 TaxID=2485105 RepID=UPI0010478AAD|nr:MarR family transcriptional regulator [Novosphingobium sp. PhB165]TCM20840.1 MarR family transcriptional regulator [Novosphingobium sp. PhB165]
MSNRDLETLPGHLIRRLQQISVALFGSRMAEADIDVTAVQFAALITLRDHPGLGQQTLAGMIAYDRVTIGGVIDRLVQKGLVVREISPTDRRARVLALTPAGQDVLERANPWIERVQEDILAGLSPEEQETFVALLSKLTRAGNELSRAPLRAVDSGKLPALED